MVGVYTSYLGTWPLRAGFLHDRGSLNDTASDLGAEGVDAPAPAHVQPAPNDPIWNPKAQNSPRDLFNMVFGPKSLTLRLKIPKTPCIIWSLRPKPLKIRVLGALR